MIENVIEIAMIRSCCQNLNQIEIDDQIWLAWNPNHPRFNARPLIALAYYGTILYQGGYVYFLIKINLEFY